MKEPQGESDVRSLIERPLAQTIDERDLLVYIRSRVLKRLTIVQTPEGPYRLHVGLSVEPQEFVLVTARGQPREWSSLDSLARQIRSKFGSPAQVVLSIAALCTVGRPVKTRSFQLSEPGQREAAQ